MLRFSSITLAIATVLVTAQGFEHVGATCWPMHCSAMVSIGAVAMWAGLTDYIHPTKGN